MPDFDATTSDLLTRTVDDLRSRFPTVDWTYRPLVIENRTRIQPTIEGRVHRRARSFTLNVSPYSWLSGVYISSTDICINPFHVTIDPTASDAFARTGEVLAEYLDSERATLDTARDHIDNIQAPAK